MKENIKEIITYSVCFILYVMLIWSIIDYAIYY